MSKKNSKNNEKVKAMFGWEIERVAAGDSDNLLASTNFRICGRLTASPTSCLNRFKIQPLHVGIYYSHLKVSRADEFDYSVVLDTPSLVWTSGTPAYYGFDENKQHNNIYVSLCFFSRHLNVVFIKTV
jgi:hypothetical protein